MAMASRSLLRPPHFSSSSILLKPTLGFICPLRKPTPCISFERIVYSKSCTSSRSADQCSGCVCARPSKAGVLRRPSGFCHTRPSLWPSGWHDEQAIHLRVVIGGLAVLNSTLPRTHSGVFGGAHT